MESIYIMGHKNPDTDSVCSSIALSYLKNSLGLKTLPKILGNISDETKFVLNYFNVPIPSYLNDVKVKIKNVKYGKRIYVNENVSIKDAYNVMKKHHVTAIPLVGDNNVLTGFVTLKELSTYLISDSGEYLNTTLDNILNTLDAEIVTKYDDEIEGNIITVGLQSSSFSDEIKLSNEDIIIVGDRYKVLDYAIKSHVKLIVLSWNSELNKKLLKRANDNKVTIIRSKKSSYEITRQIILSNYIKSIISNHNPITITEDSYLSDFKLMINESNHTNYPVVNKKNECLGLIRSTGENAYNKQKVILVDHNSFIQAVDGIEEADIIEIIDHHNLGAIGTTFPINFRSIPVGCTATIIYDEFKNNKVAIPKDIAGLLLSAILSDTLLFTSPTTTEIDKNVAYDLARIAKVNIEKYGKEMLKAGSSIKGKTVEELIYNDYKTYTLDDKELAIGQFMTMDFDEVEELLPEFIEKLDKIVKDNKYLIAAIFVTDIINNGSYIIYNSEADNIVKNSFGVSKAKQGMFFKGLVSRKKQFLPAILDTLEKGEY